MSTARCASKLTGVVPNLCSGVQRSPRPRILATAALRPRPQSLHSRLYSTNKSETPTHTRNWVEYYSGASEKSRPKPTEKNTGSDDPKIIFTDTKYAGTYLSGRGLIDKDKHIELYNEFKPHTGIVKPSPTDIAGESTEVHILYRDTSPPEKILDGIRRLCFNPSYVVAKAHHSNTVMSSDLVGVQLGHVSHILPHESQPMLPVHKQWKISKGGRGLEKIFRFNNYDDAQAFMNAIPRLVRVKISKSTVVEHHPVYGISGRRVFIRWSTHEPSEGISSWDVSCAKQTDRLAGSCNVKDVLPEILQWTFETRWEKKSTDTTTTPQASPPSPTSSTTPSDKPQASAGLMKIIDSLMVTTQGVMIAAEDSSKVNEQLSEAEEALRQLLVDIETEKAVQQSKEEEKEKQVQEWLESKDSETPNEETSTAEAAQAEASHTEVTKIEAAQREAVSTEENNAEVTRTEDTNVEAINIEVVQSEETQTDATQVEENDVNTPSDVGPEGSNSTEAKFEGEKKK
ncbi:hypothetical protein TWF694_000069 [Orbilia ellipsospora]|uniref:4a-hydroxytetrahydrobiopterin dehydratase n=1 Tax=Orbilia ellipsospora TaxID=2528407 RepID=A0AAV9XNE9_9PEZI